MTKTQLITFTVDISEHQAKFFADLLDEMDCVVGYEHEPFEDGGELL